jgi:hypothetical protein
MHYRQHVGHGTPSRKGADNSKPKVQTLGSYSPKSHGLTRRFGMVHFSFVSRAFPLADKTFNFCRKSMCI